MKSAIDRYVHRMMTLVLVLVLFFTGSAQESECIISGVVTDSLSSEPVNGARVQLYHDGVLLQTVHTDSAGHYTLSRLAAGSYLLKVYSVWYASREIPISIRTFASEQQVAVQLSPESILLQELVIERYRLQRSEALPSQTEVRADFLRAIPVLGGEVDLFRTLQLLPGVQSGAEISGGLYVRGSSPDHNLVLLDGIPIHNPSHLGGFLSTFNADVISGARLLKGAFPAEYGSRTASVLDVVGREGNSSEIHGSAGVSVLSSRLTLEGPISRSVTFLVSGRRMYADLILPLFANTETVPRLYFYDLNGKIDYRPGPSDKLSFTGYAGRDVATRPPNNKDANFDVVWGNLAGGVTWIHSYTPYTISTTSLMYSGFSFSTQISTQPPIANQKFASDSDIQNWILQTQVATRMGEDHRLTIGAQITRNVHAIGASDSLGGVLRSFIPPTRIASSLLESWMQDEWSAGDRLKVNIGTRFVHVDDGPYTNIEPRLFLSFGFTEATRIKAAYARAFQYEHLVVRNDISLPTDMWIRSNKVIEPARASQVSFAVETDINRTEYFASVETYYKVTDNLYEYRESAESSFGAPTLDTYTKGRGESYGVEVFVRNETGALTGWLGYTLSWTRRFFDELNQGRPFYPRYDRRHDIGVVLEYRLNDSWEFGASWTYQTGQAYTMPVGIFAFPPSASARYYFDYDERNGYRMPPFHKLDLSAIHSYSWFGLPFKLYLSLYNAYNRKNPFARYIRFDYQSVPGEDFSRYIPTYRQLTLFPVLPSVGLSCTF
jgi:hypothetical protein